MGVPGNPQFPGFKWGGLEDTTKNIYMDENNLRFTTNQRLQMITLANFLNDEKKFDKAITVLDRSLTAMPRKHVPYEPLMAYMVDAYYKANADAKANKLSKDLFDQCEQEFRFYSSADVQKNSNGSYSGEIANLERALQMLENAAFENEQKDLAKSYADRMRVLNIRTVSDQNGPQAGPQKQMDNQAMLDSFLKTMQKDSMDAAKGAGKKSKQ